MLIIVTSSLAVVRCYVNFEMCPMLLIISINVVLYSQMERNQVFISVRLKQGSCYCGIKWSTVLYGTTTRFKLTRLP